MDTYDQIVGAFAMLIQHGRGLVNKIMASPLPPLESRTLSSGLARRTLKNLDFIKNACSTEVHPVTQVLNSLLGLLVFPVSEKEKKFFERFSKVKFTEASNLADIRATLTQRLPVPSLQVAKFGNCKDLPQFFKRLRNAISHKHLEFSGSDPDSRILANVTISLKDRKNENSAFDWQVSMTAEDLEKLGRYVANEVISRGL
jgi:hypothetical protein